MALSYYSNWEEAAFQQLDSDMSILAPTLPEQLQPLPDPWNNNNNIDHLFDPNDLFNFNYPEEQEQNIESLLLENNDFSTLPDYPNPTLPIYPAPTQHQEFQFEPFHYPKRQKPCFENYEETFYSDFNFNFNPISPYPTLPDFPNAPLVNYASGSFQSTVVKKETTKPSNLSAQSIAARQRRRKITEKTQELGKLIPGGQKMNTAEMLQSAYKYIKYMQAQIGVLEFMGSNNQENEVFGSEELMHCLLESPLIQEKLYSSEKCLVPQRLVESNGELVPNLKEEH